MTGPDRFTSLFDAIDRMDVDSFVAHLAPDARFVYGSRPPVDGTDDIAATVRGFFAAFAGIDHEIDRVFDCGTGTAVVEGRVTYRLPEGREITLPFANVFGLEGEAIRDYRIYIDPSPLTA
jgi:limonene-1,2-epoxide hydrolase